MRRAPLLMAGVAVLSVGALAAAWVSQYQYGMQPCPWCVLQRAVFAALALLALLGLLAQRARALLTVIGVLGSLLALAGVAAALWQHFVAASQVSCNLTLADKIVSALTLDSLWPAMFSATASCADAAAVRLFGLPYEFWSLGLFGVLALAWALVPRHR
jgi:disulfide bond formation protein DsbB